MKISTWRRNFIQKSCWEGTYYNLSNFQNLYQLLSYLKNWACWTWFAPKNLGGSLGAKYRGFMPFFMPSKQTTFALCQMLTRNSCPSQFYHSTGHLAHIHSYSKPFLLLLYLIAYSHAPCLKWVVLKFWYRGSTL